MSNKKICHSLWLTKRIVKSLKDNVEIVGKPGGKVQAVITGTSYSFWDVLLPSVEDAAALTRKTQETKDRILRTEYFGRRMTTVAVFEMPALFSRRIEPNTRRNRETLPACLMIICEGNGSLISC